MAKPKTTAGPVPYHVDGDEWPPDPERVRRALRSVEAEKADGVAVTNEDGVVLGRWGSWEVPGMFPGHVARLRRLEALERAEQAERAEAAERADLRFQRWMMSRMAEKAWLGEPYDPGDWRTLMQSGEELADAVWRAQDAEDRRAFVREKVQSGEWRVIDRSAPAPSPPSAASDSASDSASAACVPVPPGMRSRSASSVSRTSSVAVRIRAFLRRTEATGGEIRR
jgi:hypothetical protein